MRKIFSAALALVCIWFATPSWGACNLYTTTNSSAGYIDGSGVVQNTSSYLATDYIAVNSSTEYTVYARMTSSISGHGIRIAFYDTNKQFIAPREGGEAGSSGQYIYNLTSPANAKYIRMSTYGGNSVVDRTIVQGRYTVDTIPTNMSQCATCDGTMVNYTSATGTVSQAGTPTPENPIDPVFYTQGDMVLRKVGNYADSYDATTGKITRRVAVVVFDGTENWAAKTPGWEHTLQGAKTGSDGLMLSHFGFRSIGWSDVPVHYAMRSGSTFRINYPEATTAAELKSWLAAQYAAGTPVTVWYPLAEPVEEDWTEISYCSSPIKIATTKYNETKFSPLNTALANAISVVDTVVSNTITQAGRIATLQAQKQTRPNDIADDSEKCPAGKKCLLVEDASGIPHWYEIVERYSLLPDGYTELQYVNMETGSYLKTNVIPVYNGRYEFDFQTTILPSQSTFYLGVRDATGGVEGLSIVRRATSSGGTISFDGFQEDMRYNTSYAIVADTRYKYTYDNSVVNFVQGNTLIASHTFTPDSTITSALVINAFNTKGSVQPSTAAIYVYSFKAWNAQGIQIANLVPAKDAGGVVGMYDTVSGTFFTNAGTGEFVAGPVSE